MLKCISNFKSFTARLLCIFTHILFFKHSQYKVTRSLQDFSGNTCIAASWWLFFQWQYFFFFFFFVPLLPQHFLSFILMSIGYLTELQGELAGIQDNLSAQAAVRWWLSRGSVCLCNLVQQCSLATFLEADLDFDIECVHSFCSSLFGWKAGCVLLWTWECGAALQKLITQGTEALCDLRIIWGLTREGGWQFCKATR